MKVVGAAVLVLLLAPAACRSPGAGGDGGSTPALGEPPPYPELAQRHNARLADVSGYYASANVEVTWVDEQGQAQREVGEGNLIFNRPDQVALTFRKLGEVYLWVGGGPERSWMFWGGDLSRAYVARNENIFTAACDEFPIPLLPAELIDLYGVFDLPPDAGLMVVPDEARSAWLVSAPGRWCHRRLWVDANSLLPVRVELFDAVSGRVWASSTLSDYVEMSIRGVAPGRHPAMPSRVEVRAGEGEQQGSVSLTIFDPADVAPGHTRLNPALFDFEAIRRNLRPRDVIALDAACARSALDPEP